MTAPTSRASLESLLKGLRDTPIATEGSDDALAKIFSHLMGVPSGTDGVFHWFCDRADPVTVEAAVFSIRLFAYDSEKVERWKERMNSCLGKCCSCVQRMEASKVTSRHTYFGAFADEVLQAFYETVDAWETEMVLGELRRIGLSPDPSAATPGRTLADAPSAVVYHAVTNLSIFQNPQVSSMLHAHIPPNAIADWPCDPPPPGLLMLAMDADVQMRRWAESHVSKCTKVPMSKEDFGRPYQKALQSIAQVLTQASLTSASSGAVSLSTFSFASDPTDLWSSFCAVVFRTIPVEMLTLIINNNTDIRRVVTGHLHDTGPQFVPILRCFILLLKRLGHKLWDGEGPEYPQIIFDSVKDNPAYSELVLKLDLSAEPPWFLLWFEDFLLSIQDQSAYKDILAKFVDLMCEELQHERFGASRPPVMHIATRIMSSISRKSTTAETSHRNLALTAVLDIHVGTFVDVALARTHNGPVWESARRSARDLIAIAFKMDAEDILHTLKQLCNFLLKPDRVVSAPSIRHQLWKKACESLQAADKDGAAMLIAEVARSAHMDALNRPSFAAVLNDPSAESAFQGINQGLGYMRAGVPDALSKFATYNGPTTLLELLSTPGVVKNVMVLMLSPLDNLQVAAQTLAGQAFDVDVRIDCFRALLSNFPDAALDGIFTFLESFITYAPSVPEACSLSKSLVRCFTDVIEVLCSSLDGLLRNEQFLRPHDKNGPASMCPKLWSLMCKSITIIFKRTPSWANYFESSDMIVWMRDALIFGRDLLAERRVIETAASSVEKDLSGRSKRSTMSDVGKKMMNELQAMLPELTRWLRLTDRELLFQSFALLQSLLDCFRENHLPLPDVALSKLQKHIRDARASDPTRPQTRLDSTRLSLLEDALRSFTEDDDDDEIQIISHTVAPPREKPPAKTTQVKKPAPKAPPPDNRKRVAQRSSTAQSSSSRFTAEDQRKLDAEGSLPTFRKPATSTSTKVAGKMRAVQPKDETLTRKPESSDSSSEESTSDEEPKAGLASLGKFQRSPKIKKPAERRTVKMMEDTVSRARQTAAANLLRQRQEEERARLRLKPNVTELHRIILSWNYDHQGTAPPANSSKPTPITVPETFDDPRHYYRVFEPLLIMECWAQVIKSKDEKSDSYHFKVSGRQFVDNWLDLDIVFNDSVAKDWYLTESDIVLLKNDTQGARKSVLAKVQSYRAAYKGIEAHLRCLGNYDPGLQTNSVWIISRVFSLSTVHREYSALVALPYYDLCETILKPRLSVAGPVNQSDVQQAMTTYRVNEPQANAILRSLSTEGFSLIQGPPGTGKTSTICGLVEAFLSKRPRPATAINPGRSTGPVDKTPVKKILICAPSNAAIDEVAHRIHDNFRNPTRRDTTFKVVRTGADKSVNASVKNITLDELTKQKMEKGNPNSSNDTSSEIKLLLDELDTVKRLKLRAQEEISNVQNNVSRVVALQDEIKKLADRRTNLTQRIDKAKDKQRSDNRSMEAAKRKYRAEILEEADVICTTLSGAGHDYLEMLDFEMVIIDEAAQAVELSSLIPLRYKCKRCIMVGDHEQLAPTVLSPEASKFSYNRSLFLRFQLQQPDAIHLLSIQYRMHPDISALPSRIFYQGRLQDGPGLDIKTKQPWHDSPTFGTYRFFNVFTGQERGQVDGHSMQNAAECQVALALYMRLRNEFSRVDFDYKVGIISMYRGQLNELRRMFQEKLGRDIANKVDFNTVDGFQGQEKDIIILSCVRAGPGVQSIGFLADSRRMNVALTRAKSSLFILGNAATLGRSSHVWKDIVTDAQSRNRLVEVTAQYFTAPAVARSFVETRVVKSEASIQPATSQALPPGLSTPHELKASVEKATAAPTMRAQSDNNGQPSFPQTAATPHAEGSRKPSAQKRPLPADGQDGSESNPDSLSKEKSDTKPRPKKRPKTKQPPAIFMPVRRPDGSAGPSMRR